METLPTSLDSVRLIKPPTVFEDFRGHYVETYNKRLYHAAGIDQDFIQDNRLQVLVPPKFGNGHVVMSEQAIFHYKQTTDYDRSGQFTLVWNDPALNIWWPVRDPIVSQRDQGLQSA